MARTAKKAGGKSGYEDFGDEKNFGTPRADWKAEQNDKVESRTNNPKIKAAAEERKKGGRAKRKHGGVAKHHESGEDMKHAKHVGKVHGAPKFHAGKAGRATGGRAGKAGGGSNFSPLSSAHAGTAPRYHKTTEID